MVDRCAHFSWSSMHTACRKKAEQRNLALQVLSISVLIDGFSFWSRKHRQWGSGHCFHPSLCSLLFFKTMLLFFFFTLHTNPRSLSLPCACSPHFLPSHPLPFPQRGSLSLFLLSLLALAERISRKRKGLIPYCLSYFSLHLRGRYQQGGNS